MYNKQSSRSQSPTNLSAKQWQIARLPNLYQDGLERGTGLIQSLVPQAVEGLCWLPPY
jgi:hypothetical protein